MNCSRMAKISRLLAFGFAADRFLLGKRRRAPTMLPEFRGLTMEEAATESLHMTQQLLRGEV